MRDDRLDEKIKKLLNSTQEEYDTSSWDKLSQRLDSESELPESSGEEFIPIIKEKLENQRASVPEEHWSMMSSELDYIEERRRRLYIVKFLEAAIILLLVFTYFHYTWYGPVVEMDMAYIEDIKATSEDPSNVHAALGFSDVQREKELTIGLEAIKASVRPSGIAPTTIEGIELSIDLTHTASSIAERHGSTSTLSAQDPRDDLPAAATYAVSSLDISPLEVKPDLPYIVMTETKGSKVYTDQGWSIGLPISYDVNFINTDLNLGYLSNQIESGLGGRSYGLSLGYRRKNIELESGLRYSEKTFVPGKLTSYTKTSEVSFLENRLDNMAIKQLEIPLLFKFYAAPVRNTSLYGVLGFGFNAILHNQYQINRTIQPKARLAGAPTSDLVNLQELPQGIIRGGSLKDNLFVTGVIGFGIQSSLTPEVNWYLQPQYQHSFTGKINQIVDRVNTLSIEGGVKFLF